jgi:uncharacterized membrane protein YfcA
VTLLAALLAFLIGITLGLLGGGGSILTVPVFAYALDYDPKAAIAMSLPVVGGAALVGAYRHWRMGHVDLRTALPFGLAAMLAAFVGARLARFIPGDIQLAVLGIVMLGAAFSMLRPPRALAQLPDGAVAPHTDAELSRLKLTGLGLFVGLLTGIVGVGGGFLIVPALVLLGGVMMKHAVGTSLLLIAANAFSGYLGYHGTVDVDWGVVLRFGSVAAGGILAGSAMIRHVDQGTLKRAFAVLLFAIAAWVLWQNRTAFLI